MAFLPKHAASLRDTRYFGIDLAKRESQLAVVNSAGKCVANLRFLTMRENFLAIAAELREGDVVALEVTTNAASIARLLKANSAATVILSNPIETKKICNSPVKTDKVDARVLAELARVGYLPQVWVPNEQTEALRHLFSDRRSLVDRRTELKNTVHSILHRNLIVYQFSDLFNNTGTAWLKRLCSLEEKTETAESSARHLPLPECLRLRSLLVEIKYLEQQVEQTDSAIAAFVLARPDLKQQLDLLLSIPGVSLVVGAGFLAAIGDITRFKSAKQLACYFGLTPKVKQSGDSDYRTGRISKKGNAQGRWLAVEAAEHLAKAPGALRQFYQRIKKRKGRNVAMVAVARKLVELAWHLLTKNQEYIYAMPRRTDEKRARVRFLAKQNVGLESESAALNRASGRTRLYGSGLQGRRLKNEIVRQAALEAEARYLALIGIKKSEVVMDENNTTGFDPRSPNQLEWERILAEVAKRIEPAAGKAKRRQIESKSVAEDGDESDTLEKN